MQLMEGGVGCTTTASSRRSRGSFWLSQMSEDSSGTPRFISANRTRARERASACLFLRYRTRMHLNGWT